MRPIVTSCLIPQYVSFLSVCGNLALALLTATMAFRIYKSVLAAVNKGGEGHPFRVRIESKILIVINLCCDLLLFVAVLVSYSKLQTIF